jgi:hypothetical protein
VTNDRAQSKTNKEYERQEKYRADQQLDFSTHYPAMFFFLLGFFLRKTKCLFAKFESRRIIIDKQN